ncbi:hypothetical protein LLID5_06320 [Lactococcus lactis]|nr:hypothetical protein LLID5_06320 [Lactococcus lactis]
MNKQNKGKNIRKRVEENKVIENHNKEKCGDAESIAKETTTVKKRNSKNISNIFFRFLNIFVILGD